MSRPDESLMESDYRLVRNAALWSLVPGWIQQIICFVIAIPLTILAIAISSYVYSYWKNSGNHEIGFIEIVSLIIFVMAIALIISYLRVIVKAIGARNRGANWTDMKLAANEASGSPTVDGVITTIIKLDQLRTPSVSKPSQNDKIDYIRRYGSKNDIDALNAILK